MKGNLFTFIVGCLGKRKSIPFMFILLGAIYLYIVNMFESWQNTDITEFWYYFIAAFLFILGLVYTIICFVLDHLPRAAKGTKSVLFCIDAASEQLYEAAKFQLVENFNEANIGDNKAKIKAICVSKKQVNAYDLNQNKSAQKLLKKTRCVLLVKVRYTANSLCNADDFELRIGCGILLPKFDEKAGSVLVNDMSMVTSTVQNQHFSGKNAIDVFNLTTHTLSFACNYILGFVYLLAKDGDTAYLLLTTARKMISDGTHLSAEQEKWRILVDDRLYATLFRIACDQFVLFQRNKEWTYLQKMEQALEIANTIYSDEYSYCLNMAYIYVTLHGDGLSAKRCIDKCRMSKQAQFKRNWMYSDAFLSAYLEYDPGTVIAKYTKAFAKDRKSNLVELAEHIEFIIANQPEKIRLHLAAGLVYEVLNDTKLMKQHFSVFLNHDPGADRRIREVLESKINTNLCEGECNHNCEKCAV